MYMKELTIQDIETIVHRDENRVMEAKETTGELVKGMQSGCAFLGGQGTGTCPNASYDNMEDQYTFDYPANKIIETRKSIRSNIMIEAISLFLIRITKKTDMLLPKRTRSIMIAKAICRLAHCME